MSKGALEFTYIKKKVNYNDELGSDKCMLLLQANVFAAS